VALFSAKGGVCHEVRQRKLGYMKQ